jgi:hypothetical protein
VGGHYFIRALIELPITGTSDHFAWGVWTSLSEKSYARAKLAFERRATDHPPYFGWLQNELGSVDPGAIYPPTLNLPTHVHAREGGLRPAVEILDHDHPLSVEQRSGITLVRVKAIVSRLEHSR